MTRTIVALTTAGIVAAGCTTLSGDQGQLVRSDIQRLDRQVQELRRSQGAAGDVAQRLAALEKSVQHLGQQFAQMQRMQADLTARYDAIRQDQMTLTGRFEEAKHLAQRVAQDQEQIQKAGAQLAAMDQRLRQLDQDIDALRRAVEQLRAAGPGGPATAARPGTSPATRPGATTAQASGALRAEAIYKEAFDFLNKGDYPKARERFEAFLKADPNSDFAEGAMYLIADTYYKQKDYENAILRYEELVARFPKGRRVPAALFYQAIAFRELGAPRDARVLLERVVKSYPNSTEAQLARAELPKLPAH